MSKMISDRAQVEISGRAKELMRVLSIPQWSSEPHSQWQNPAERRIQYVKQVANTVMDMTNAPSETWFHCFIDVCFVLNHLYDASIGAVPLTALNGISVDISVLLRFTFWERVYYAEIDPGFPSDSCEAIGYILGISEHVGNAMCYMIYNPVTKAILHRARCRPIPPDDPNYRAKSVVGEKISNPNSRSTIKSLSTSNGEGNNQSDTENGEQTEEQQDNPKPILIYLGMDFERGQEGVLCITPKKYIEKMIAQYHRLFGVPQAKCVSSY